MKYLIALTICALFITLYSFQSSCVFSSSEKCLFKKIVSIKTKRIEYWIPNSASNIIDKIQVAPPTIVTHLNIAKSIEGLKPNVLPYSPTPEQMESIKKSASSIPKIVSDLAHSSIQGIFLVENLGSTGYTEYILDEYDNPTSSFIAIDVGMFKNSTANIWASWKLNSVFKSEENKSINLKIEEPQDDNFGNAFQFILLHEIGHAISLNKYVHPNWDLPPRDTSPHYRFKFFHQSWHVDKIKNRYLHKNNSIGDLGIFPLSFYNTATIELSSATKIYETLFNSNFPTLYATVSPSEDWADSFAAYVHQILLKKPYSIYIKSANQRIPYFNCFQSRTCQKKVRIIESLIGIKN